MSLPDIFLLIMLAGLLAGILSGVPVMLVLVGVPLLASLAGAVFGAFDLSFLRAFPARVFGLSNNTLLVAVPLFVAMGLLLERSRSAERMLESMAQLTGGSRTSLAVSVLVVSALIAASTGIIGATIVMLGLISLPAMTRAGIPTGLSSGLVCASGTLGQIIPPSIVLILLGDQISNGYLEAQHAAGNFAPEPVSVADLFAGALLPGLLLVGLYGAYVAFRLWRPDGPVDPSGTVRHDTSPATSSRPGTAPSPSVAMQTTAAAERPGARQLAGIFLPPLALILSVLGSILGGVATPTEAAAVGAGGALLLAGSALPHARIARPLAIGTVALVLLVLLLVTVSPGATREGGSLRLVGLMAVAGIALGVGAQATLLARRGVLAPVLRQTVAITAMVFGIIIGASMLSLVFRGYGGDERVEQILLSMPGDELGTLIAVMAVVFLLGFVLEFVEIIFIVVPIVGPVLLASAFDPVWIAVLFALNLQTSFLTPPFGFALFYFRSVAPASLSTLALYRAVLPFVALQLLALCLVARFPAIATWLPGVLR